MRESKTTQIGEFQYTVIQMGSTAGRKVMVRLAKVIGAGMQAKEPVGGMLAALTDEDLDYLCDEFAKTTTVKLSEKASPLLSGIFEEHFAGKYFEMLKWLGFCLEVNFGSFLGELGLKPGSLTERVGALVSQSTSQKAPTGQSGE